MNDLLDLLTFEFFERPDAPARMAVDYFRSASDAALKNTLRFHGYDPVVGRRTIDRRASFDALLSFYGLIEIGCCEGLIELDETFSSTAKRQLGHAAVKAYYEQHYPLLLPQLLHRRLEGDPLVCPAPVVDDAYSRYVTFLDLRTMLSDPDPDPSEWTDVEEFWWLLDDGETEDGYVIDDLVDAFTGPGTTAREALLGDGDTDLHDAIRGMYQFLRFAGELQPFLDVQPNLIGSLYWHQYGYWFDRVGDELLHVMKRVFAQIGGHEDGSEDLIRRVGRLTSGRYAWILREVALGAEESLAPSVRLEPLIEEIRLVNESLEKERQEDREVHGRERQLIREAIEKSQRLTKTARLVIREMSKPKKPALRGQGVKVVETHRAKT